MDVRQLSLVGLIGLGSIRAAAADPTRTDIARARWNDGAHALAKRDLEGARFAFLAAYDALPDPELAHSLGEIEFRTGHFAAAVRHLTVALDSQRLTPAEQKNANRSLKKALERVGLVFTDVDVEGADILVDGELVGRSPAQAWYLDEGDYVIAVHKDNYSDATQKVEVTAKQTVRVSFGLSQPHREASILAFPVVNALAPSIQDSPTGEADSVSIPVTRPSSGSSGRTAALVTGATLTVIAAGVGGYFWLRRSLELDEATAFGNQIVRDNHVGPYPCTIPSGGGPPAAGFTSCQHLVDQYGTVDSERKLAIASFATAGVLGAATVAAVFLWPRGEAPKIPVAPMAGGAGIVLRGDF